MPHSLLKTQLGRNLKRYRKANNLTQREFAERIGVGWTQYQRWESGQVLPRPEYVDKISGVLGVTSAELYGIDATIGGDDAMREQIADLTHKIDRLVKIVGELVQDEKAVETVPPSRVQEILKEHDVTLSELARANHWLLPDGRPDPTKAGREIGKYGSKKPPKERIEKILEPVGVNPEELP